jgi:hypothetical protein
MTGPLRAFAGDLDRHQQMPLDVAADVNANMLAPSWRPT